MLRPLVVAAALLVAACGSEPLPDEVGTSQATFAAPAGTSEADMERTVEILEQRLAALEVEGEVRRNGVDVTVAIPDDREEVFVLLARTADLHFHPVVEGVPDGTQGQDVLSGPDELDYRIGPAGAGASDVESAEARASETGDWTVQLVFTEAGLHRFNELAARCFEIEETCRTGQIAVVVDGRVVSAPAVLARTYGNEEVVVSGDFTERDAVELAALLRTGELPVPLVRSDR